MAYENKYLDSTGVKHLWDKAASIYVQKEAGKVLSDENYSAAEKEKLAILRNYTLPFATTNVLGGIKIGDGLRIDENGVVHTVYNPEMPIDWDDIQDLPTTLAGYGITDAATKTELEDVRAAVSEVYRYKGSVPTVADLDNIANPENGDVYDVEENGANYAWNANEERWDNLGGLVGVEALSNYELDIITGSASSVLALKELIARGGNVDMAANLTFSEPITVAQNVVLDLGGNTLSYSGSDYAFVVNGATITFKNGTIQTNARVAQATNGGEIIVNGGSYRSNAVGFVVEGIGSKFTLNAGEINSSNGGIGAFNQGSIEINGGDVVAHDFAAIFTDKTSGHGGNSIVINNGNLFGNVTTTGYESCCVYIANNDTFVMNNGTLTSSDGCGILMRAGTVTINNGSITAIRGDNSPGKIGDDATQMSASAVIYHESANFPGKANMSLTITDGLFTGTDHSVEILSNETTPNVHIEGGDFNPAI